MNATFVFEDYDKTKELFVGQKVRCVYYHEYRTRQNEYHNSFIKRLLDKPFEPVKYGIIVGDAGIRPYWLNFKTDHEQYLYVKFKEYFFNKAIPISCIEDLKEAIIKDEKWHQDPLYLEQLKNPTDKFFDEKLRKETERAKMFLINS